MKSYALPVFAALALLFGLVFWGLWITEREPLLVERALWAHICEEPSETLKEFCEREKRK